MDEEDTLIDVLGFTNSEFRESLLQAYRWSLAGVLAAVIPMVWNVFDQPVLAFTVGGLLALGMVVGGTFVDLYYKRYLDRVLADETE